MDISLGSDGQCTGVQPLVNLLPWRDALTACCFQHDLGATDGWFFNCINDAIPYVWGPTIGGLFIGGVVIFRPIYNWLQRKGWAK